MDGSVTTWLYLDDAYCLENDAVIVAVDSHAVVVDRSCMYPGGGGQPPDRGKLVLDSGETVSVVTLTRDATGAVWHVCDVALRGARAGHSCKVHVDGDRRLRLMRFHTALHVFNTVMLRSFGGWITGVGMGPERSHIDFQVEYRGELAQRVEEEVNDVLARHLAVGTYYISADEFHGRPDLLRTLEAEPPVEEGRVRVVEISGFEAQACGGTHVRDTGEVGRIRVVKVDNKGRRNRRFYIELMSGARSSRRGA